jgi:16S rRNA C1402 N4-methylase RsmH
MLFALLALADISLLVHLHRRRQRRYRVERMMQSLRIAVQREIGTLVVAVPETRALILQQAS